MTTLSFTTQNRIRGGAIALMIEALLGYVLVLGFTVDIPKAVGDQIKLFNLAAPPPPPPIVTRPKPQPTKSHKARGAASPRNIKSKATDIVAPPPILPPIPPPVIAAPKPNVGFDASTGATRARGPGTGAGGIGTGTDSGGSGEGEGGDETGPKQIRGKIKDSDYPRDAMLAHVQGTVSVRYTVETDGRATHCTVTRSSGSTSLDVTTCRLIEERYRFRPAKDAAGRPVISFVGGDHEWYIEDDKSAGSDDTPPPRDPR